LELNRQLLCLPLNLARILACAAQVFLDVEERQIFDHFDGDLRELFFAEFQVLEFFESYVLNIWLLFADPLDVRFAE
jgi:hypothetical protein